jgi:transposase InsO family protein
MQVAQGKLGRPARLNAAAAGQLLYLTDQQTSRRFLVDSGTSVSLLPHKSRSPGSGSTLIGPDGAAIRSWGRREVNLSFGSQSVKWTFLQAAVAFPILGLDFLQAQDLLLDATGACLVHRRTGRRYGLSQRPSGPSAAIVVPAPSATAVNSSPRVCGAAPSSSSPPAQQAAAAVKGTPPGVGGSDGVPSSVQELLQRYQDVINPSKVLPETSHGVVHHLLTTGPPIASPFRRLDAEKLAAAKAEFSALEKEGIVRRSTSPWASPLHMVRKPDGSWRPCGDYRRLNNATVPDTYPLPNMMDFQAKAAGCWVFSKIDLRKGYHQIPMNEEDVPKTAITTPFGLFEYTWMTFGMRNAGNTFQRLMDRTLAGHEAAFGYLDDVLVSSPATPEHLANLQELFERLRQAGLVVNGNKCLFAVPELDFLGHRVSAPGIAPLPDRVAALQRRQRPSTVKELQGFLGAVNFYCRFVPTAARILRPLTDALRGGPKPSSAVEWSSAMERSFVDVKNALARATLLAHPSPAAEISLATDTSAAHVGTVLQQRSTAADPWQPLGFFSQKLDPAQTRYSAFDRELLACVLAIRYFRYLLEGRQFAVFTDHKPLTYALHKSGEPWTARQARHLSYVAEFTGDIRHLPGSQNVVADALSRPPPPEADRVCSAPATAAVLDMAALAAQQRTCPSVEVAKASSLDLQLIRFGEVRVLCDVHAQQPRPFVPLQFRRQVFDAVHGLAHPGIRATRRLLTARWCWEGMSRDVVAWCRDCQHCARAKVHRQLAAALQAIPVPAQRFSHVHVDIVGPLPVSSQGLRYLFTMVDRTTRWLEAVPLRSVEAATCAAAFVESWVARFGVPAQLTSDQGRQFTSAVWSHLSQLLGVLHINSTAYHPQSNGVVERAHRQLKAALRARLAAVDWPDHLPWVLLGLRAAPKEDSGVSAAELLYGSPLALPGQLLAAAEPPIADLLQKLRETAPLPTRPLPDPPPREPPAALITADYVYIRRGAAAPPLAPPARPEGV